MTPRRLSIAAVTLAVVVLLAIGLLQAGSSPSTAPSTLSLTQMRAQLAGSPEPFASLHAQAGALLPGGLPALRARLAALRGQPLGPPDPSPPRHAQAGGLRRGGLPALRARLAALRGQPLVINKWASWCGP